MRGGTMPAVAASGSATDERSNCESRIELAKMKVRVGTLGKVPLIELQGEIDHSTSGILQQALDEALGQQNSHVLVDLAEVEYMDSGALSVLLTTVRSLRGRGWLGGIAANANVRRLLEIVGLLVDPSFRLFVDRVAAEQAVLERSAV